MLARYNPAPAEILERRCGPSSAALVTFMGAEVAPPYVLLVLFDWTSDQPIATSNKPCCRLVIASGPCLTRSQKVFRERFFVMHAILAVLVFSSEISRLLARGLLGLFENY